MFWMKILKTDFQIFIKQCSGINNLWFGWCFRFWLCCCANCFVHSVAMSGLLIFSHSVPVAFLPYDCGVSFSCWTTWILFLSTLQLTEHFFSTSAFRDILCSIVIYPDEGLMSGKLRCRRRCKWTDQQMFIYIFRA